MRPLAADVTSATNCTSCSISIYFYMVLKFKSASIELEHDSDSSCIHCFLLKLEVETTTCCSRRLEGVECGVGRSIYSYSQEEIRDSHLNYYLFKLL